MEPTQLAGSVAYTFGAVVCAAGWLHRRRNGEPTSLLAIVTVIQLALLLDMVFNGRWILHDFWERQNWVREHYEQRRVVQLPVLAMLFLVLALGVAWIAFKFRRQTGEALVLVSIWLSVGLWSCEIISYHFLDQVLYRMVGPVMLVSLMWIGLALFAGLGVLLDRRRPSI